MRNINMLVIHCAATPPEADVGVKEINIWHRKRGFFNTASGLAIGYHFVIRRDGTVEEGRPVDQPGAHAKGYNTTSIGICLVGGIKSEKTEDGKAISENNFTQAQWSSLEKLVKELVVKYNVSKNNIYGHNQLAAKDCPCFDVPTWVNTIFVKGDKEE